MRMSECVCVRESIIGWLFEIVTILFAFSFVLSFLFLLYNFFLIFSWRCTLYIGPEKYTQFLFIIIDISFFFSVASPKLSVRFYYSVLQVNFCVFTFSFSSLLGGSKVWMKFAECGSRLSNLYWVSLSILSSVLKIFIFHFFLSQSFVCNFSNSLFLFSCICPVTEKNRGAILYVMSKK